MSVIFAYIIFFCFLVYAKASCQPPDVPFGGSHSPVLARYLPGDRVFYTCRKEFTRIGRDSRSCQAIGKWSGSIPFCDASIRGKNPRAFSDPTRSATKVVDGNVDTCYSSHNSTGQMLQVFLEEPRAINVIRLFLPKGPVKLEVHTYYKGSPKQCTSFDRELDDDQWIQLDCLDSRNLVGSIKFSDVSSKANVLTVCEIEIYVKDDVWCQNPPEVFIPNGHLEVSREKATLLCNPGFSTGENTRLVCDKNNTWTGPNLQCNEILCDLSFGNSSGVYWQLEGKKPSVGSRRILQCQDPSFSVTGQPLTVTCRSDGTWTPTTAKCVRKEENKNVVKIVGIVGGTIVVFMIFLCLGLTLYFIYKQKGKKVVVVYTCDKEATSEPEYSSIYYEPAPPTAKKLPKNMVPSNIPFGTLKSSTLYGNL